MATKQQLEAAAEGILAEAEKKNNQVEQFCIIWKGTIRPALELIKLVTGKDLDAQIDKLIYAADGVCSGTNPDVSNYCNAWRNFHLKSLFKIIQLVTGPKVDKAIDKFVAISDSLCPQPEE